jgi:Cdc6-like AAA superfamily ATPase
MSSDFPHLEASARHYAQESPECRIRRIRTDRWITYSRAESALTRLEDLLSFPQRTRMPNLLLVGPTNNGKTMIIEKFKRSHPATAAKRTLEGTALIPVVKVQMPAGPDELRFFGAVLDAIGFPYRPSERLCNRQDTAMRMLRQTRVRMLVIDEVHNLLSGSRLQQRRLLNVLRWLGNELQIPLVAVGTAEAFHAVQSDDQLANRFEPVRLPVWEDGPEYRQLLSTLEAVLPLRCPSQLHRNALAEKVLAAAEGILGEIIAIVSRAAVQAVTDGSECITAKLIDELAFLSPSQRRRVAV